MKLIMLDLFRRRVGIGIVVALLGFEFGFMLPVTGLPTMLLLVVGPFVVVPLMLPFNFQHGYPRIALSLPLTAREIGRTIWWLTVAFPAVLFAVFSGLGVLAAESDPSRTDSTWGPWLGSVVVHGLLCGALFWLFSGSPAPSPTSSENRVGGLCYFLIFWGCVVGGTYYLVTSGLSMVVKLTAFCLVCTPLTIMGWLRAEWMVVDYGEYRSASQPARDSTGQFKVPMGRGGIPFILQTAFVRVWGAGLLLFVALNTINFIFRPPFDWHHLTKIMAGNGNAFLPWGIYFMLHSAFLNYDLRLLRAMPLSAPRLAAGLHAVFILPMLTFWLCITALAWIETGAAAYTDFFRMVLLTTAPLSTVVPGFIWESCNVAGNFESKWQKAVLCVAGLLGTLAPAVYQMTRSTQSLGDNDLPFWFVLGFPVVIAVASYWATIHLITRSSGPYRVSPRIPAI